MENLVYFICGLCCSSIYFCWMRNPSSRATPLLAAPNVIDDIVLPDPSDLRWVHRRVPDCLASYWCQLSADTVLHVLEDIHWDYKRPEKRPIFLSDLEGKSQRYIGEIEQGRQLYAAIKKAQVQNMLESHLLSET